MSMGIPNIDEIFDERGQQSRQDKLCFRAQEILYAYHVDEFDMLIDEDTPPEFKLVIDKHGYDCELDDDDDDESFIEDVVTHFRTQFFELDSYTRCIVDNVPLVAENGLSLRQLIIPGYVAIKAFAHEDYDALFNELSLEELDNDTTQLIFRLPFHHEGSGIFQGFSINEHTQLPIEDRGTRKQLKGLLEGIVDILRSDVVRCAKNGEQDYGVQSVPVPDMSAVATKFLNIHRP